MTEKNFTYREPIDAKRPDGPARLYRCSLQNFSGVNEFMDYIKTTPLAPAWARRSSECTELKRLASDKEYTAAEWRGARNFAEVEDRLRNGVNIREMRIARAGTATAEKWTVTRGTSGSVPIVPAYLSGCPQNMLTLRRRPERRNIRVFVDTSIPWNYDAEEILRAGEHIVEALAKLDRVANYDLVAGITNIDVTGGSLNVAGLGVTIKTAGKPFSASRVSFCLTSPAFLRVLSFLWMGRNKNISRFPRFGKPLAKHDPSLYEGVHKAWHKDTITISVQDVVNRGKDQIYDVFKKAGIDLE